EASSQHALGGLAHLLDIPDDFHPTGFATAASVHLRLDHPYRATNGFSLSAIRGHASRWHRDPVASENILRLILVQIHRHRRPRKEARILPKIAVAGQQGVRDAA